MPLKKSFARQSVGRFAGNGSVLAPLLVQTFGGKTLPARALDLRPHALHLALFLVRTPAGKMCRARKASRRVGCGLHMAPTALLGTLAL